MAKKPPRNKASMSVSELLKAARTEANSPHQENSVDDLASSSSATAYCAMLVGLSPEDRYDQLKMLNGNQLFVDAMRLLPPNLKDEFFWFEKIADLESTLKHVVPLNTIRSLIEKGDDSLESLVTKCIEGDEFWFYHSIPGDTGYALVRESRIVDFCTLEVWSI